MEIDELETLVHSLAARVGALEAENAALREQVSEATAVAEVLTLVSRRQWLARGAVVAAGTLAGAAVTAAPVAADTGPINMNVTNTANNATKLQVDLGTFGTPILQVWNLSTVIGGGVQGLGAEFGVQGYSSVGEGGWFEGAHADLRLGGTRTVAPTGDNSTHTRGEIAFVEGLSDSGEFWACVQTGQPGRWRKLAGFNLAGGLTIKPSPTRVYDSRPAQPPAVGSKTPLANAVDRTVDVTANSSGVPSDATAVLVNLTALKANGAGWLSVRSPAAGYANTSNLNFTANATVANLCAVSCSTGDIVVRLGGLASACDVLVDVVGYFR